MNSLSRIVLAALVLFAFTPSQVLTAAPSETEAGELFSDAGRAYEAGEYKEAAAVYERLIAEGRHSSNLYYNLGNAWYRLDEPGRAALNFQRALLLNPQHFEAKENLDHIRRKEGLPAVGLPWISRLPFHFGVNGIFIATSVFFWVAVASFCVWVLGKIRWAAPVSILSLILAGLLGWQAFDCHRDISDPRLAVVVAAKTPVRFSPAESSETLLSLPAGANVRIESERGTWVYARTPDGQRGWLPAGSVQRVANHRG